MNDQDNENEIEDIEDIEGAGDGAGDADDAETETETDDGEETDGEETDGADDAADGDDDGGDDGDEDDSGLGKRAQKRIGKLIAAKKEAEGRLAAMKEQLERAKRLGGDDGKAILAAAEKSGILPELMSRDEAEAFGVLDQYPAVIEGYRDWLDEHEAGDELEVGDRTMSYGEVKKRVRRLEAALGEAKDGYGERRRVLQRKIRKIFELGLEAYRKGGKAAGAGGAEARKASGAKRHDKPFGTKPKADSTGGKVNWGSVKGEKDFVAMIAAQNKGDK